MRRHALLSFLLVIATALLLVATPSPSSAQQTANTTVKLATSLGEIEILLLNSEAPRTVANFLSYVNSGAYNNSFVHRSVPGFVIQGGGYRWDATANNSAAIPESPAVANEFGSARPNVRGTIAMARIGGQPNSATNQWFINLADNRFLDTVDGGFTVFGRVSEASMRVVDAIARLPIVNLGGVFAELPVVSAPGSSIARTNLMMIETAAVGQATPISYQGLWWNAAEAGWGVSITQKGTTIFAATYSYDASGRPAWYVLTCPVSNTVCTGQLFRVPEGTSPTLAWAGTKPAEAVGNATLTFLDSRTARYQFTINGLAGSKNITQLDFATGTTAPAVNYTDIWWNANESGWGLSLTHQFSTIFAAWYTYDAAGGPTWYTAANCVLTTPTTCTSPITQIRGGSALTSTWAPALQSTTVGNMTLTFSSAQAATMRYTLNDVAYTRTITRLPF
jgi:cyclophilin family peptidyl-prolyl cis-trans isomerase